MNPFLVPWSMIQHALERECSWEPPASSSAEQAACFVDRNRPAPVAEVIDLMERARDAKYRNGKSKRFRYRPVDLGRRRVIIVLHQTGFEAREDWPWWKISSHTVITPGGRRARLHPYQTRLVAANRLDRSPWHAISIEVVGNFEGEDGTGNWWSPQTQGRGRASEAQVHAVREEIRAIVLELERQGYIVEGIVPHRISGRNSKGRPDRPLCCGSRVWSECGEWAGAALELAVPGPDFKTGGMVVSPAWRGRWWGSCLRLYDARGNVVEPALRSAA